MKHKNIKFTSLSIKRGIRFFEIEGETYLVNVYEHNIMIFFPLFSIILPHKAYKITDQTKNELLEKYGIYNPNDQYFQMNNLASPENKKMGIWGGGGIAFFLLSVFGKMMLQANFPQWLMDVLLIISSLFVIMYFIQFNLVRGDIGKVPFSEKIKIKILPVNKNAIRVTMLTYFIGVLLSIFVIYMTVLSTNIFAAAAALFCIAIAFGISQGIVNGDRFDIFVKEKMNRT